MAAVHPAAESPKRLDSPVEEAAEEPGGRRRRDDESESNSKQTGIFSLKSAENSSGGREEEEEEASVAAAGDAACISGHTEASGAHAAGAASLGKPTSTEEKKAHDDHDVSCDDQPPGLNWSSDTEDEEDHDHKNNTKNPGMRPDALGEETRDADAEKTKNEKPLPDEMKSTAAAATEDPECEAIDGSEELDGDDDEDEEEKEEDSSAKQKTSRLQCKECGMRFKRREMYNLHRYSHAHQDELTPLTCKECGLTFQHRSSLLKHRCEHKEKEESSSSCARDERSFGCAQCEKAFPTADELRGHSCASAPDNKPYHCPLCRQEFQYKLSITKHMQHHSAENVFACQECNRCFSDNAALRCHQRCHAALKPYQCPECGMVFKHYSVMEDHRRKHTDNMRTHQCNICGKTFKYSSLLHQHQYLHTGQKPFRCPDCGKNFAFAQNMKAHCRQHRPQRAPSPLSTSEQAPVEQAAVSPRETGRGPGKENAGEPRVEPKRSFKCPLCPQMCSTPAHLRAHMLIHEAEYEKLDNKSKTESGAKNWDKGHTCPHCPSIFRDESSFYGHILKVHKSIAHYLEKVTQGSLHKANPLNADNAQGKWRGDGANGKSYKCSECGKVFRHRSVLELHMRIHSKDKPYQCKVCHKGFRFGSYLQQHLIIHTGKKPYRCPDCGKDFAFLQNMRTHQKLHQEKPFRCTSCRKGYSDETQLQQHMLSHNGDKPHKCDQCDKSFGLAYLLRDHMNTHTGERPHRCDECDKSFSWFSSLLVHQKIHNRKPGPGQYSPIPPPGGVRMRGRGSRGRRGARFAWGWPRSVAGSGMIVAPQPPPPYQVPIMRDPEWQRRGEVQLHTPAFSAQMEPQGRPQKEPWVPEGPSPPVQWKVDGGEVMPLPLSQQPQPGAQQHHQRAPGWLDSPLAMPPGPGLEPPHAKESTVLTGNSLPLPQKPSLSAVSEMEQHRQRIGVPTSTAQASTSSSQQEFPISPTYMDGAALWSIRPPAGAPTSQSSPNILCQELQLPRWSGAPLSIQKAGNEPSTPFNTPQVIPPTVSLSDKPWNGGLASATASAHVDQSSALSNPTAVSHGAGGGGLWDFQSPLGVSKTLSPSDKLEFQLQQQKQLSSWAHLQQHRFPPGLGTTVWGFQSNPVGLPQTLLAGPLKVGNGQELLQHQPMVTGTQIIINQPSPYFPPPLAPLSSLALPGAHPLHSVAVSGLPRPPHPNIFFPPQVLSLSLPQLASRAEAHKLGGHLPFAPERLLQCMICGCSLPRELDLQMHYRQHAQGDI